MMIRRQVTRETLAQVFDCGRKRNVLVTIDPLTGTVELRLKGTRRRYGLPASYLYWHACQKHTSLEKARKAKGKRKNRKAVA